MQSNVSLNHIAQITKVLKQILSVLKNFHGNAKEINTRDVFPFPVFTRSSYNIFWEDHWSGSEHSNVFRVSSNYMM